MEDSWTRPRYPGYLHLQDHGGDVVRDYLLGRIDHHAALADLNRLYRESLVSPN
ncbi:MAG: hypothetical protein ACO3DQ_03925 [Cephaloticoccus sp.]